MISVGVDVSKGKSTVCILKPYGEVVSSPFEIHHVEKDMEDLDNLLSKLDGEVRVVMEATGIYHLPIVTFLHDKGYFVSVVNPFAMKKYAKDNSIRGAKTDRLDSIMIANYGIEKWFKLQRYEGTEETYAELKLLGRRYRYYMELHVKALQELTHVLDYVLQVVMPENYVAMFYVPGAEESAQIIAAAQPSIDGGIACVQRGEPFPAPKVGLLDRFKTGPVNTIFYRWFVKSGPFTVSDACIGCGKCALSCPVNGIDIVERRPHWNGACTHCMACICGCPVSAIEYGHKSQGKPRYQCPEYK